MQNGAVLLGVTRRLAGVLTGGGGAWRVHEGDGEQEPTGTGYLRMRSGKADELSVPRALQSRVASSLHRLQLKPWEDGGLSALWNSSRGRRSSSSSCTGRARHPPMCSSCCPRAAS